MFTTRGNPVTYYGDEQGFVGTGGDQAAREDMFASQVELYNTEKVLAGPEGPCDRTTPSTRSTSTSETCRRCAPSTRLSPTAPRSTATPPTAPASSRCRASVRAPRAAEPRRSSTSSPRTTHDRHSRRRSRPGRPPGVLTPVSGTDQAVKADGGRSVTVTVPPLSVSVWRANKPIRPRAPPRRSRPCSPTGGAVRPHRGPADVTASTFAQTSFMWRPVGATRGSPSAPTTTRRSASSTTCPASRWRRRSSTARSSGTRRAGSLATPRPPSSSGRPRPFRSSVTRRRAAGDGGDRRHAQHARWAARPTGSRGATRPR